MEEVRCEFKYSRAAAAFLAVASAATLALVALVPFPGEARVAAFAYVVAAATLAHGRIAGVHELRLDCAGFISVRSGETWTAGSVRGGSFVAPWLMLLRWRPESARFDRVIAILPDMASAEELRRIRVILRWA